MTKAFMVLSFKRYVATASLSSSAAVKRGSVISLMICSISASRNMEKPRFFAAVATLVKTKEYMSVKLKILETILMINHLFIKYY